MRRVGSDCVWAISTLPLAFMFAVIALRYVQVFFAKFLCSIFCLVCDPINIFVVLFSKSYIMYHLVCCCILRVEHASRCETLYLCLHLPLPTIYFHLQQLLLVSVPPLVHQYCLTHPHTH